MESRWAAYAGAVACALVAVAVAAPYLLVAPADQPGVGLYYALGAVNPVGVAFVAVVGVVAFAAGARGRSDPVLVAGLTLAAGLLSALATVEWALSFGGLRQDVVGTATRNLLAVHRWAVVGATALWGVAATGYARALGLLGR